MKLRSRFLSAMLFAIFLLSNVFATRASAQVYKVIDLGSNGATTSGAVAINDSGQIVGNFGSPGAPYRGFFWEDSVMIDLGTLGGTDAAASGINNRGEVVGYSHTPGDSAQHAFHWNGGVMLDLFSLGGSSFAEAIDDSGRVVGWAREPGDSIQRAVLWEDGVLTDLGSLGGTYTSATSINNARQVVGNAYLPDNVNSHGFLWENGSLSDIGTLGGIVTIPHEINRFGEVVGLSTVNGSLSSGFFWDEGVMTDLGVNGPATGINDISDVVGYFYHPTSGHNHAFLWEFGTLTDLNELIDPNEGWILDQAHDINNNGEIVGWGHHRSQARAFLLKPVSILLTDPVADALWISGERDTIRWISSLGEGENVILWYTLNGGATWLLLENNVPADAQEFVWTVPDTLSTNVRILIMSSSDAAKNDTTGVFTMRGYTLSKQLSTGEHIVYNSALDRWGFGNTPLDAWPGYWTNRFDYTGTDPFTGGSYLLGEPATTGIFLNALPEDHPDWPSFVRTYGAGVCYRNTVLPVYSPTAVLRWASIKGEWGGSCFGFAVSNGIAFRNKEDFRNVYTEFPFYLYANQVLSDTNTIPVINELYTHQFGEPHRTHTIAGRSKTPNQTLKELKDHLLSDALPVRSLTIFNNGGSGGHAILPYKVRRDGISPNLHHVSVYDNSYPDVLDAELVIDTAANGGAGSWTYPLWPGWGGGKWILLADAAVAYLQPPSLWKNGIGGRRSPFSVPGGNVDIHPIGSASVRITDTLGRTTGYSDSLLRNEIPGSTPLIRINGSASAPYGYRVASTACFLTLDNFTEGDSRVFLFTGDRSILFERSGATSAQTDRLWYDGGLSVVNPDDDPKTVSLVNVVNFYLGEMVVSVRALTLERDDSVRIENVATPGLPLTNGLKISSFGASSRSYTLGLEFDAPSGARLFSHALIQLEGASSHIIQPVWTTLVPGTNLNILVDQGNDGTIDDTLHAANQVTSVPGTAAGGIPAAFALHQNYPNPFNPVTVIRYDLPVTAYVSLKVFDVMGREVATLIDVQQSPGMHAAAWESQNLPSGIYFYRLTAGTFTETKKMVLVR